ncbi:MAG TPA: hypothetical protein VIL46_03240 [Gemmataceae bacterium]
MSEGPQSQYEFTPEQNQEIGGLAHKMRWVGLFFVAVGVVNLIVALLLLVAIFQNRMPSEWVGSLPEDVQAQMRDLPPNHRLWGFVINAAVGGVIYLLIGIWTRAAAVSFQRIVDTRGNDIANLMNGMGSLHKMYGLVYFLLVFALILLLIGVLLALFGQLGT